jgi:hypothetical protein
MKKHLMGILAILCLTAGASAITIEAGLFTGLRTVSDALVKETYGQGIVFYPTVDVDLFKGLTIGAGYELGYSRKGKIGDYEEDATLEVSGFEFFFAYQLRLKSVVPFISLGGGLYSYKQTIVSDYARDVDATKMTFVVGGGVKFYPFKGFYVAGEFKYVPLKVQPFEDEDPVDLSGLRLFFGVGYSFRL